MTHSDDIQPEKLDIIYQDKCLIAIHKPAGLLVHKSPIDKHETRYAMKILRDQIEQWVYPVHRLDKPTSGLLLFALNPEMAKQVGEAFEKREIHKEYHAIVRGFAEPEGLIDHSLKEIAVFKHMKAQVEKMAPKEAITGYQTKSRFELPFSDGRFPTSRYSYLQLRPDTGRKHQLRRHMKHISHPIIGDVKYGKGEHNRFFQEHFASHRLLLAATSMSLSHPETEETITLDCPLEDNFQQALNKLYSFEG
jgi:tRNA pseudouridine65 synthase